MTKMVKITKYSGEDVPAMYLRERLFLQDLAVAANREVVRERQISLGRKLTVAEVRLVRAYSDLVDAVTTVEAFLALKEERTDG